MSHYYDGQTYTSEQAEYARELVLKLMKNNRFFIGDDNVDDEAGLDPKVFGAAVELNEKTKRLYAEARSVARSNILSGEKALDLSPPNLDNNRQLVVCNRYGGGFEIYRVYPLSFFAAVVPQSAREIANQYFEALMGRNCYEEVSERDQIAYQKRSLYRAERTWSELRDLEVFKPNNQRCMVLLRSRMICDHNDKNGDFADSRLAGMQQTPFATSYLFWRSSLRKQIVRHSYVVFETSSKSHIRVTSWRTEKQPPAINFDAVGGYSCRIIFASVL